MQTKISLDSTYEDFVDPQDTVIKSITNLHAQNAPNTTISREGT